METYTYLLTNVLKEYHQVFLTLRKEGEQTLEIASEKVSRLIAKRKLHLFKYKVLLEHGFNGYADPPLDILNKTIV